MNTIIQMCFGLVALILFSSCTKDEPKLEDPDNIVVEKRPSINDYIGVFDIEGFKLSVVDTLAFTNQIAISKDATGTLNLKYLYLHKDKADYVGLGFYDGFNVSISQDSPGYFGLIGLAPLIDGEMDVKGDSIFLEYSSNACTSLAIRHFKIKAVGVRR